MIDLMKKTVSCDKQSNNDLPNATTHRITSVLISAIVPTLTMLHSAVAYAEPSTKKKTLSDGMMPLIELLQDFAFPVGVGIAMWGLIEWMLDNPRGKERVKGSLICYVGIFVVPHIFIVIRDAFRGMLIP